jgi:hypothetical protein
MNIRKVSYSLALVAMFAFTATVSAQGPSASDTASANLEMSAEVQTTVQLNIGGTAVTGSNSTGLFAIDFGNVNALGIGSQPAGVTVTTNSTGALYQTPITLTPVWTGFVAQTADIFVQAGESADQDLAREGSSLSDSGGTATSATPSLDFVTDAANGSSNARVVGMYIPKTEVAGSKVATLIYTVVVAP